MHWRVAALGTAALLAGCALGPDYERPELDIPVGYVQPVAAGESIANLQWWEVFKDPQLNALITIALEENQDLRIATARIEEFRGLLGITRADQFPQVDIAGAGGRSDPSENAFPGNIPGLGGNINENYSLSADVSFVIDLFGRLRRSTEAARAQLLAIEENQRAVTISLISSVATAYMTLRDLDQQLVIARRTEATRARSVEIIQARFDKGTVARIDLNQAEIQLKIATATVASAERAVAQTENLLAVLIGRKPGPIARGAELKAQVLPPAIPTGLPSELLQRRPDVRAAEAELAAQTALIGVAEAIRWPSLSLTGSLGLESQDLSDLTEGGSDFWSVGVGLLAPIYNAGRNRSRVDVETARTQQALLGYEASVLRAFREVEDALIAIRTYRDEFKARQEQVTAARSAATLSRARYNGGVTSYLEVLETDRSLFNAELVESQTLRLYFSSIIELYAALGGGWVYEEEEPQP